MNYDFEQERLKQEVDEWIAVEIRAEISANLAQEIIEWMAALSAVNGRWDDVLKDVRWERITLEQANRIAEKLFEFHLINEIVLLTMKTRVQREAQYGRNV